MDCNEAMEAYEHWAPTYDGTVDSTLSSGSYIPIPAIETFVALSLLRNIRFNDVLDAGTGTGECALRLAQMGKRVVGIDTSPQMLAQARAKADELRLDIDFQPASVLAVPSADESFDLVICALTLAHVKDLAGAVRELVRVLRCGGHLIITDLHPSIQKTWGPNHTAVACEDGLVVSDAGKEALTAREPNSPATAVPLPNYHGEVSEYLDSVKAAGTELVAAFDLPIEQGIELRPGSLVIFARKSGGNVVEPAAALRRRRTRGPRTVRPDSRGHIGCNDAMEAYERGAATYDEKGDSTPSSRSFHAIERFAVLSMLRNIRFNDVLDAGTGTGWYALRLAQMGKRVVGVDASPQMLAQARAKANELRLDIDFKRASVLAVPQADESFDLVTCAFALAHVKDLAGAIQELVRVLRCGGHLIITDLHPNIQKVWGPTRTALVYEGRLLIDGSEKDREKARDPEFTAQEVPFPQHHGEIGEYFDSLEAAGAELLAAFDIPLQGLRPGSLVVFARKSGGDSVEPAAAQRR